jgi:hypothetical protein
MGTSSAHRGLRWRMLAVVAVTLALVYVGLSMIFYRRSLIIETSSVRLAAVNQRALLSLVENGESTGGLEARGQVFPVPAGSRGRIVQWDMTSSCSGQRDHLVRVEFSTGPLAGRRGWLCLSEVRFLHPPP